MGCDKKYGKGMEKKEGKGKDDMKVSKKSSPKKTMPKKKGK